MSGSNFQIGKIKLRQERIRALVAEGMPEVGIWWYLKGRLISDTLPWKEAPHSGGFYNGPSDHYHFWGKLQSAFKELRNLEYDEVPRGRVLYDANNKKFLAYGAKGLIETRKLQDLLIREFRLHPKHTLFEADEHYKLP